MLILRRNRRITVTPGFLLLLATLFYLDDGVGIILWVLLAAVFHEIGHICASACLGGKMDRLVLSVLGAELQFVYPNVQPYWKENIVALAGPAMNFLVGRVLWRWCGALAGAMSFGLGLFNLLPVLPLDGGTVAYNLSAEFFGLDAAEWVSAVLLGVCVGSVAGIGVIAMIKYANITIISLAVWMLINGSKMGNKK